MADPGPYRASPAEVEATFGQALAAQPSRAAHFTLYFVEGSDQLTEESKQVLDSVLADLSQRAVPDVLVVGHTDAVGTDPFNDALARQRAEAYGSADRLAASRRPTWSRSGAASASCLCHPDGIAEPRNRRVEIIVR